jgi:hypothetical protein
VYYFALGNICLRILGLSFLMGYAPCKAPIKALVSYGFISFSFVYGIASKRIGVIPGIWGSLLFGENYTDWFRRRGVGPCLVGTSKKCITGDPGGE